MISQLLNYLVETIASLGYMGIFFGMVIESSFIPFPSEIIMIPAGYLAFKGEMNMALAIFFGILGSFAGATVNYFLAKKLAKPLLLKFGKYFFISEKVIHKSETFFHKHGEISTLTGRLIPGIRQIISLPAGAFGMPFFRFLILTGIGSGIWVSILAYFGFFIGQKEQLILDYMPYIKVLSVALALVFVFGYLTYNKLKVKI